MAAQTPPGTAAAPGPTTATTTGPQGTGWTRAAALTGVVFVAALVASVVLTFNSPNTDASTAKITHYILAHKHRYGAAAILTGVAVIAGISFAVYLRTYLRRFVPEWMTSLFFVGVVIVGVSGTIGAGVQFALSDHPQLLSSDSLRLLNDINQNLSWASLSVGLALIYAAVALMIRSAGTLPAWLGWLSWLVALLALTFFLSFISFLLTAVFALITSIRMAQRNPAVSSVIRV